MSNPKRQHFIPKSYIRQFSDIDGDKAFVQAYNVNTDEIKYPFSIANLCVAKNIYTLPTVSEGDKYYLETFYAQNVDSVYPEVYRLLTDPRVEYITEDQRHKILYTTLSLYFRSARFLDAKNQKLDLIIERLLEKTKDREEADLFFSLEGRAYRFNKNQINEVKEKARIDNRIDFIFGHLEKWHAFVNHKTISQITVSKITDDINLISCDNPVSIYNHRYEVSDIFDPSNSIRLPLDQKHILWISPNDEKTERNRIYRGVRDKWFALTSNHSIQKYASDWIFSKQNGISEHFEQQKTYNEPTAENFQAVEDIKTLALELSNFVEFAEKNGGITSKKSLEKLKELKKIPAVAKDPMFIQMCLELKKNGYII